MTDQAERIVLSDLVPVDYNPRLISPDEMIRLTGSIRNHSDAVDGDKGGHEGFRLASTVTLNRQGNRIVGGHQRIKALIELGQEWIDGQDVTWVDLEPNGPQEKALNIALNSDDASGSFDYPKLQDILLELDAIEDFDLSMTALAEFTIEPLLEGEFNPGTPDPGFDNSPPPEKVDPIFLTAEQRDVVERAVELMVSQSGEDLDEGKAVELICSEYMRTNE